MKYQDTWIRGQCIEKGERECADRYEIVRAFCAQYSRPFSVLDIGANLCYFGLRLTEDFRECTVCAIECDDIGGDLCARAAGVLRDNEASRVILLAKKITLEDLRQLSEVEHFDVVLCLSVIHRFEGTFEERVQVMRSLGDHLILEVPNEDCTGGNVDPDYTLPEDRKILGYGKSHLVKGGLREIVLLSKPKITLKKAYLGSVRTDLFMAIYSDFQSKRVHFFNKPERRDWLRGINLQTYLAWNGIWPAKSFIRSLLEAERGEVLTAKHCDIQPWNVLLGGDTAILVDARDPNMEVDMPDEEYFGKLLEALR